MFKDVDECREGTSQCQPPAERCVNMAGTYRCEPISLPTTTRATTTNKILYDIVVEEKKSKEFEQPLINKIFKNKTK